MKVRVTLVVEVDPETWEMIYGTGRKELRDDVKQYALGQLQQSAAADEGGIIRVTRAD